jgi:hypothetical protein
MPLDLVLRSLVAGTYLAALVVHGSFSALAAVVAAAMVLIWAAPLVRDAARRRSAGDVLTTAGAAPVNGA